MWREAWVTLTAGECTHPVFTGPEQLGIPLTLLRHVQQEEFVSS